MRQMGSRNFLQEAYILFVLVVSTLVFFALPQTIFAANIYFTSSSQNFYTDDTFIVEARIDSEEKINVVEGSFSFNKNVLNAKELSTGGSVFSLWAQQPSFSNDDGTIYFVGGTPEGFQGQNKLILKAVFVAKNEGESKIVFVNDTVAFLSDGKGTKIQLIKNPLAISILPKPKDVSPKDEWEASRQSDNIKPEFKEATISRDYRLFNNQYFVSFFATDIDSGVAYYEIKEGDGEFKKVESPHVLFDQTLNTKIYIKVVDNAGNESILSPEVGPEPVITPSATYLFWIIGLLFLLFVAFMIKRFVKRKI